MIELKKFIGLNHHVKQRKNQGFFSRFYHIKKRLKRLFLNKNTEGVLTPKSSSFFI